MQDHASTDFTYFKYCVGKPYVSVSGMTNACPPGLYPKKLKLRRN